MVMDNERLMKMVAYVSLHELRDHEATREQILEQFRDWIAKNSNIIYCRTDDSFLLRFLRMKKFSLPLAEQTLLRFLKLRQTFSHLMFDLDIRSPQVDDLISSGFHYVSPHRDDKGRSVVITAVGKIDPDRHTHINVLKAVQLSNAARMEDDVSQVLGYTYILDMSNVNGRILSLFPLQDIVEFVRAGEKSTPMRNKEIHFINMPQFLIFLYNMFKGACSGKIQQRFMIHDSLKEFQEKVNPKCLPEEYGGRLPAKTMAALWKDELISKRQLILDLDKMKLRDTKMVDDTASDNERITGISGLQGSFKKIEID